MHWNNNSGWLAAKNFIALGYLHTARWTVRKRSFVGDSIVGVLEAVSARTFVFAKFGHAAIIAEVVFIGSTKL